MSFSYSGSPSSSAHDAVRFLVGDTDPASVRVQDEEITFLLDEWEGDLYQAAAAAADFMAATAAQWLSYSADGNSLTLSELQGKYMQLADQLRGQGRRRGRSAPYAGGIDAADHVMNSNDESVNPRSFALGMHDDLDEGATGGGFSLRDLKGDR